jgi:hypothetical protein
MDNSLYLENFKFSKRKKSMYNQCFLCEIVLKMDEIRPKLDDLSLHRRPGLAGRLAEVCSSSSGNLAQSLWPTAANIRSRLRVHCGSISLLSRCGVLLWPLWNHCVKHAHIEL